METKIEDILMYVSARAAEPETWRGVAVIASLLGGQYATLNWGECAALGAMVSGVMKIIFPTIALTKE